MKLHHYNQMMVHLTRRKFSNGGSTILPKPNPLSQQERNQKVFNDYVERIKKYLTGADMPEWFVKDLVSKKADELGIELKAEGGTIGGGTIQGQDMGDRTGFKDPNLIREESIQELYDAYGKEAIDKAAKEWAKKSNKEPNRINKIKVTTFNNLNATDRNNFKRKYLDDIEKYGEWNPNRKFDSRQKRVLKDQGIQIKLLEATNKEGKFNPVKFAKDNDISMKELKKQSNLLQGSIYDKRMLVSGKDLGRSTLTWIPENATISDNALSKLHKSGLITYERNKIDELFYDAFGRKNIKGTNKLNTLYEPKKFLAIKENLNEYRQLKRAINLKYPSINFELDHPLSKSTLKNIFNSSADQLTRVNILDAELNNNFKKSLSSKYENAISTKNLKAKKAVEKVARELKLNIGKVSTDLTGFDYGVKEFQKLNIRDEIIKSLKNQKDLNLNFKKYIKNNPDLLTIAGYTTKDIERLPHTKITKVTDKQIKEIKNLVLERANQKGIKVTNSQAGFIANELLGDIAKVGGKVLKGAGVVGGALEPAFAAMNFSEAIDAGLSGKESGLYTVGKFGEDVVNIPGILIGAKNYLKDKFTGQGEKAGPFDYLPTKPKFKTPYEATFARDWMKKRVDATPEDVKQRRIAERDFDTTVLPNMTMVDDIEMPAPKEEIETAKETFLEERGVKKPLFGKYANQIKDIKIP